MSARHSISLFAAIGIALTIGPSPSARAQDAPVIVGTWTLNIDKTEPAKDKVIEEMSLKRHRASYDAWIIQETYKRTLKESD